MKNHNSLPQNLSRKNSAWTPVFALAASLLLLGGGLSVQAQPIVKAATGTDLTATASWTGNVLPSTGNIATWNSTGPSLGPGLTMATSESWLGISAPNASGAIAITGAGTLTLGTGGIDMSAAAQSLNIGNPLTLGGSQSWNINSGRNLTLSGTVGMAMGANVIDGQWSRHACHEFQLHRHRLHLFGGGGSGAQQRLDANGSGSRFLHRHRQPVLWRTTPP